MNGQLLYKNALQFSVLLLQITCLEFVTHSVPYVSCRYLVNLAGGRGKMSACFFSHTPLNFSSHLEQATKI